MWKEKNFTTLIGSGGEQKKKFSNVTYIKDTTKTLFKQVTTTEIIEILLLCLG